ncbi:MAG: HAD family phosphatase [Pseudomonadota bacterium]
MTAVVFDVGNVLLDWDARRIYRDHFPDDPAIDAFFEEIGFFAWNIEQDRGRSWADGVAWLSERHREHADLIALADTDWQRSVPGAIQETVEILANLKAAGTPLYAITNFSAEKWDECLVRFPFLTNSFRGVFVSAHEKLIKPDPAIFELFLQRYEQIAEDCIFIDDSPANVASALALGFDALQFQTPSRLAAQLSERGLLA